MGMGINSMGTIASVHNFLMLQNFKTFYPSPSTRFRQQQKLKILFKFVPPDGSIDTRVFVLFQIYNLRCRSFGRNFSMTRHRNFIRALRLLSTIKQSEFCLALLVLKKFLDTVLFCVKLSKKSR